ncbi:hypothetical protein ACNQUF_10600, partial [Corynebacterium diphtheriae]
RARKQHRRSKTETLHTPNSLTHGVDNLYRNTPQTASELPQYPLPFHPQHTHPETFAKFVNATYTIKNDLITRKTLAKRPPQS